MNIFAHRGVSGHYPENTLQAIKAAVDCGAYGIEIDVFAVDGELIVIHDRQLKRTTNAAGNIEDYTWAQLQQLKELSQIGIRRTQPQKLKLFMVT